MWNTNFNLKAQSNGFPFTWVEVHNCLQKNIVRNYFTSTTTSRSQYSSSWRTVQQYVSTHTTRVVLALLWSELQYTARNLLFHALALQQHRLCVCWYRSLMYCATEHTELVVRSSKKMMSQHFKMCTKSTTHIPFISIFMECCVRWGLKLEAVVPSNNGQCECCTWILKKSLKCQIRRYHLLITWLKN